MLKKLIIASLALLTTFSVSAYAESPADLNDLEITQVAYTPASIEPEVQLPSFDVAV